MAQKLEQTETTSTKTAKNIIMFLGDGMSVHTVTATRNLLGDSSKQVYFEKFPYFGLSKTYCIDRQVADSACSSTAYLGGVKGNYGTIGVNANVKRYNCFDGQNPANWVDSIAKWAQDAGKDAGLVTTARVTHASPAGAYAHISQRDWENDAKIIADNCSAKDNVDIARQLVEWDVGRKLKVIMGGGRSNFIDASVRDEEGIPGDRADGRNLIKEWLEDKRKQNSNASYVWSRKGLNMIELDKVDYLLGLFSPSHCPYHGDLKRSHIALANPSLSEMTEAALKVLKKNNKGFFLFVEGARIDMAHHDTRARKSLEDTEEFAKAVQVAREMFSEDDTLIVVTSDHSHTMTINGYPVRCYKIRYKIMSELCNDFSFYFSSVIKTLLVWLMVQLKTIYPILFFHMLMAPVTILLTVQMVAKKLPSKTLLMLILNIWLQYHWIQRPMEAMTLAYLHLALMHNTSVEIMNRPIYRP